jgi:hypothetical protein
VVPFWSPPRSVAPGGGRHRRASFAHLSDLHISTPAAPASLGRELSANDPQERGQITAPGDGTGTRPGPARNTQLLLPAPFALPDPVVDG